MGHLLEMGALVVTTRAHAVCAVANPPAERKFPVAGAENFR